MPDPATRAATVDDLEAMVSISSRFRRRLQEYQPTMWNVAADADQRQRGYFEYVLSQDNQMALVAESGGKVMGFGIAGVVGAPPVYDPGGPTCMIDDLAIDDSEDWLVCGRLLLEGLTEVAKQRGCAQVVVICPHLSIAKRELLQASELTIASEWWTKPL